MLRRVAVSSFALVAMAAVSTSVFAQAKAAPKGTTILLDAKIEQVLPAQGIVAVDSKGKKYAIAFDAKSKIGLSGETGIENIKPGTFVQFEVELDGKGVPTSDVKKVQVTTQSDIVTPGVRPSKGPDYKEGEPDLFFVRGTVRTNKDGSMTVVADKKTLTVKVAIGATVPVTIADWRMAKKDDTIKGNGTAYPPSAQLGGMTPVMATQMEIKAAGPIGGK